MKRKFIALFLLLFLSCSSSDTSPDGGTTGFDKPTTFFSTMTSLTVDVAYEPDAVPYTGNLAGAQSSRKLWDITQDNLDALFLNRNPAVTVNAPEELSEMQAIPDQSKTSFTSDEILTIAGQYRRGKSTSTDVNCFIVFLNGYFSENGAANENVIGVSLSGTTVLAIFKPVVESTQTGPLTITPKYVEQSTIVHEVGHALGLVNNGIPMHTAHQDDAHGKHCNNDQCLMYYLNEGKTDLIQFVTQAFQTGSLVIFDQNCLDDARNYKP